MSLKKANFLLGCKKENIKQLLIFCFKSKKPPPDVPLRGFAKLSTLKDFFGKLLPLVKFHFFRLCLSFFRSPKRTLGVYSQDRTKEIVGLGFLSFRCRLATQN